MEPKNIRKVDLTKCFNCYTCEKACEKRHDYQRNVRNGKREGHFVLPIACRQCSDPVCVKSCKLGAHIRENGISYIIKDKCIGCGLCAKKCPFGSIVIVELKEKPKKGQKRPKKIANKCDLCRGYKNRACFSSCPSSALAISY